MKRALSADGTPIAFERSGIGQPLILVDGALCSRSFGPMPKLVPLLEPHFTVYWYDRRGRNDSGETAPYSVAREVEDLEALVNEAGGSACVYGVSSGAALALEAAAQGVKIRRKLALYEPPLASTGRASDGPRKAALNRRIAANRRSVRYFMRDMVGRPGPVRVRDALHADCGRKLEEVAHTLPYDAALVGESLSLLEAACGRPSPSRPS